ncbi:MAG: hypothetical protein M3Y28_05640 [Armatimonadota bacterium]|nr:hypothetical protein [Armatimonadota bacterium]
MKKRIRVTAVGPGVFSTENAVSFEADGKEYTLLVDKDSLKNNMLEVQVVAEGEKEALIDLPRDTFTSGSRIRILKDQLLPA